jgi:ubiquinone biosynthesis protein
MRPLVYVAGWTLWPFVFGALAARLLGVRIGPVRIALYGLAGVCIGALASNVLWATGRAAHDFVIYVLAAMVGTLVCVAAVAFLARPISGEPIERSIGSRPRPLHATHLWVLRVLRYATIVRIAWRYRLLSAPTMARAHADPTHQERLGHNLTEALQEASGIFVKLGQVLSTRRELLPAAVVTQLELLQDRVEPASAEEVDAVLDSELGAARSDFFESFEDRPLAAASLGQVHRARLRGGEAVAVKIQRPDVEERVERDLDIILRLAERLERSTSWARRAGVTELARGFAANLREELDYRVEAQNTMTLPRRSTGGMACACRE